MIIDDLQFQNYIYELNLFIKQKEGILEKTRSEMEKLEKDGTSIVKELEDFTKNKQEAIAKVNSELHRHSEEGNAINNEIMVLTSRRDSLELLIKPNSPFRQIPGDSIEKQRMKDPRHLEYLKTQIDIANKQKEELESKNTKKVVL